MPSKNIFIMAIKDLFAKKIRLLLTLLGIVVGVAALIFLLSLTAGVRKTVLKELVGSIPVTELTATPKEIEKDIGESALGGIGKLVGVKDIVGGIGKLLGVKDTERLKTKVTVKGSELNDEKVEKVKKIKGVKKVYPIKTLNKFSTGIEGWFLGIDKLHFDTQCVASGIPYDLIKDDLPHPEQYFYNEKLKLEDPPIPEGSEKLDRKKIKKEILSRIERAEKTDGAVPLVINKLLLQTFNMFYAGPGRKIPKLSEKTIIGQYLYFRLAAESDLLEIEKKEKKTGILCKVIGLSNRAPIAGFAIPPRYIDDWEKTYFREKRDDYQQLIVIADSPASVNSVKAELEKLKLSVSSQKETIDKINTVTRYMRFGFSMVGAIILTITAIGIVNVLTMSVNEEKVDIGILRAVGARKHHIRMIYLLKAATIGIMGGTCGMIIGFVVIKVVDIIALQHLHLLAYSPESLFFTSWDTILISFGMGFVFSLAGGISPANHAANLNPATVLQNY